MLAADLKQSLEELLSRQLNKPLTGARFEMIGGGSINETYRVTTVQGDLYFVKINSVHEYPGLFEKEARGLEFLGKQQLIRVPVVIACEVIGNYQVLVLEWIKPGNRDTHFWKEFGTALARLHHVSESFFGFDHDNYMGALPQVNSKNDNWPQFFVENRLQPQLELAIHRSLITRKELTCFERLYIKIPDIFNEEKPSLLHGDLWSGNFMCDEQRRPVLIDPAVYFGHRSVDLGMTTLFGGFAAEFYDAYHFHFPFPANYREQWEVANLYPLLIHLNLFGSSYLSQIKTILRQFS